MTGRSETVAGGTLPFMGKVFAALDLTPDLIVSLTSVPREQTAGPFAGLWLSQPDSLGGQHDAASAGELMSLLRTLSNEATHVLLVAHNPGIEDLAAQVIGASAFGMVAGLRLPTAGAAHIELGVELWQEVQANSGRLLWLVNPRILQAIK